MSREPERAPESPTALGIRFGLPIAGLSEITNAGEVGAGAGGLPLADGLQAVPGQSGAEALANLHEIAGNQREDDPADGP